ncbi:MAG: class I SAM-dependent methyltransferase [Granulosicoccus sp.]
MPEWIGINVLVKPATETDQRSAARLAQQLDLTLGSISESPENHKTTRWILETSQQGLSLHRPDGVNLRADFTDKQTTARQNESGRHKQPLARAIGIERLSVRLGRIPLVIDATGGLGRDAWFIASLGCQVTILERHPVLHALLQDAHERALKTEISHNIATRLTLIHADASDWLKSQSTPTADVIHLDPMYPDRRRRAASKKGAQFLHALAGSDIGNSHLLRNALARAGSRVVVKRPQGAPLLEGSEHWPGQRTQVDSPNTRYDIYHV